MTFLASLNPQQREAVIHGDGPLLILAGAGSGKTRVIVCRIARLILEQGVDPDSILGVTFTNKAAGEMRDRVVHLLAENGLSDNRRPLISTFHSFCVRVLRRYGAPLASERTGFGTDFLIFDDSDRKAIVKDACKHLNLWDLDLKVKTVMSAISRCKNRDLAKVPLKGRDQAQTIALNEIYEKYEAALLAANALDFDDLLLEALRVLESFKDVREALRSRYRHLLVDEFQDTNRPQYEILRLLVGERRNVCVVGDDDQAIYSWRGANINNILGFETDFPRVKVIRLEQNYRSTQAILDASSALITHNQQRKHKSLWTDRADGARPALYRALDGDDEARYVAHEAEQLLEADPDTRVAILYRTNAQSRLFEEALRRVGLEFLVVGGLAFYQRAEVKDLLAYLKAAVSPGDPVSLRRIVNVPARGIGKTTLARLDEYASTHGISLWEAIEATVRQNLLSLRACTALRTFRELMTQLRQQLETSDISSALEWVFDKTGYRTMLVEDDSPEASARLENIEELLVAASEAVERGHSLADFLDHAALVADSDGIKDSARILLMTLHTAKGLEFPSVMLVGMEESLLPHGRSMHNEEGIEEERRLCYVGMTRARRHLLLTCAQYRRLYAASDAKWMDPSRFLEEIPKDLLTKRPAWNRSQPVRDGFGQLGRKSRDSAASARVVEQRSAKSAGIETHDSVSAVAGFFRTRGIKVDTAPRARPKPSPGQFHAPRRDTPKLGQALKTLRKEGPFARGTRVRHRKFGVGVVESREGEGPTAKLSVYFQSHGRKRLVAGHANLQEL